VNQGALLAGPLLKRSDWLHAWNPRFAVLTTEALAWLRLADGSEPMKAILLISSSPSSPFPSPPSLCFRASTPAELRSWHRVLGALLDDYDRHARAVQLLMQDR